MTSRLVPPLLGTIVAISAACAVAAPAAAAPRAGSPVANSFICMFTPGPITASFEAEAAARSAGGRVTHVYRSALSGFALQAPAAAIERMMARNRRIAACEENRVVTVPDGETNEASVDAAGRPGGGGGGGTTPSPCAEASPWGIAKVGGPVPYAGPNRAWVIDSGIAAHTDLALDVGRSRSFISGLDIYDQNSHGTHVAGTIAAKCNGTGVVGVAAGAPVVSLRVLNAAGSGDDAGVLAALDEVAASGAAGDVVNLSLSFDALASDITGPNGYNAVQTALNGVAAKSIFIVIAAGNNSAPAINYLPAALGGTNTFIYTVSAFDSRGNFASFSNYGNPPISYSEPGVSINSTVLNNGYGSKSGTSMAAPHLAGILLAAGAVKSGGTVKRDRDATPDPIGVR